MDRLPNDMIMRELTKAAFEQCTQMFAQKALEMSKIVPDDITGKEALVAFANAIYSTNSSIYGRGEGE